jgi:L-asparaginase
MMASEAFDSASEQDVTEQGENDEGYIEQDIVEQHVSVVTTGGTICMAHDDTAGGDVPTIDGEELVAQLPGPLPPLKIEELTCIPSSHLQLDMLWILRDRVKELMEDPTVKGIVITHGTDTMEETAYLLDIAVPGDKPIVLTGAMRTTSELGYDGTRNLLGAIQVAAADNARGIGAVVVANDEIHAARRVSKVDTMSIDAFQSPGRGPIGRLEGDSVVIDFMPIREPLTWYGLEPNVQLVRLGVAMEAELLEHLVLQGARGVVIEALGSGRVPPWWLEAIEQARAQGVQIVVASRCLSGRVGDSYGYPGAYRSLADLGCLFADGISGAKARIRMMVVLAGAQRMDEIKRLWNEGNTTRTTREV